MSSLDDENVSTLQNPCITSCSSLEDQKACKSFLSKWYLKIRASLAIWLLKLPQDGDTSKQSSSCCRYQFSSRQGSLSRNDSLLALFSLHVRLLLTDFPCI
ncbi:hypothetical protein M5689_009822 [Euphorbia peplus]|nr:hypothetical protein M5689_009822 [Euphorbia peplus]